MVGLTADAWIRNPSSMKLIPLRSQGFLHCRSTGLMKANVQYQLFGHGFSIPEWQKTVVNFINNDVNPTMDLVTLENGQSS